MDSIVEKNDDDEVKERASSTSNDIQETSTSIEAASANTSKKKEDDSTEEILPDACDGKNTNDSEHGKKCDSTDNGDNATANTNKNTSSPDQHAIVVPESTKQVIQNGGCADNDSDSEDDSETEMDMDTTEAVAVAPARSSMALSSSSLSRTIPKRKRPRLENSDNYFTNNTNKEDEDKTNDDEDDMQVDVSLNQLKRQVLGRDLKVDDGEHSHDWEDEEDAEIRQIRALMNESSNVPNDDTDDENNNNPLERATTAADTTKDAKDDATERNGFDTSITTMTTATKKSSSKSMLTEKLRNDLMCAICHEVVYPPVALQCGHSFCQPCIDWWFDHDDAGRCPTCRRRNTTDNANKQRTSPNLALRACVMAMFGPEIVLRLQNRKKLPQIPKGEHGGTHDAGYRILNELQDETWHYIAVRTENGNNTIQPSTKTIQVRRSIVLDAEDQRMQLALGVYYEPIKEVGSVQRFRVELCLLTMEEDEAVDSGFPTNILSPEDEYFVCGGNSNSSRFLYTHLDVQMKDQNGRLSPLARVSADANDGRFKYVLDPSESAGIHAGSTETIRALLFDHSETGAKLEIDLAQLQNRAGRSSFVPPNQNRNRNGNRNRNRDHYYSDDENYGYNRFNDNDNDNEEEDEEVENQDEFEEDGFLVGDDDDDESNVEGAAFSDDEEEANIDEEDSCVICKDGGELMVCDGGDKNPGCGKSFHAVCVNRSAIPDGDWICQGCAKAGGIETGIVGYEFREPQEETPSNNTKRDDGHALQRRDDASCVDLTSDCNNDDNNSDVEGAFSDDENQKDSNSQKSTNNNNWDDEGSLVSQQQRNASCVDLTGGDNSIDSNSDVEGVFSDDENQKSSSSQKSIIYNMDDEDCSMSQQQLDCEEEKSAVKPSGRSSNKIGTKRRFVLEDSDSDE